MTDNVVPFSAKAPQEPETPVSKALNRVADALFRQAKAAERAVALQEEMVANQRQMARSSALLEQHLMAQRQAPQ